MSEKYKGHMAGNGKNKYSTDMPYFSINGHNFNIKKDTQSKSELNIVKTKMYVPANNWGYNDIQFVNFTGEELSIEVYSRINETYNGERVQPDTGALKGFYDKSKTPHAVLKYWAQCGVTCEVSTNLQAYESGDYIITDFSQSSPEFDLVVTNLTLTQYEKPAEVEQTYWKTVDGTVTSSDSSSTSTATSVSPSKSNSLNISATAKAIKSFGDHRQTCACTADTPYYECTSTADSEVVEIQGYLQKWGYFPVYTKQYGLLSCNGKYCYYTTQAVAKLQEEYNIPVTGEFSGEVKDVFLKLAGVTDDDATPERITTTTTNTG